MREKVELKPCPFCGGIPNLDYFAPAKSWHIVCRKTGCNAFAGVCQDSEKKAVKVWNTRVGCKCNKEENEKVDSMA